MQGLALLGSCYAPAPDAIRDTCRWLFTAEQALTRLPPRLVVAGTVSRRATGQFENPLDGVPAGCAAMLLRPDDEAVDGASFNKMVQRLQAKAVAAQLRTAKPPAPAEGLSYILCSGGEGDVVETFYPGLSQLTAVLLLPPARPNSDDVFVVPNDPVSSSRVPAPSRPPAPTPAPAPAPAPPAPAPAPAPCPCLCPCLRVVRVYACPVPGLKSAFWEHVRDRGRGQGEV